MLQDVTFREDCHTFIITFTDAAVLDWPTPGFELRRIHQACYTYTYIKGRPGYCILCTALPTPVEAAAGPQIASIAGQIQRRVPDSRSDRVNPV